MFIEIQFLFECFKFLGFKRGLAYYRVYRRCKKNPALILTWAKNLKSKAAVTSDLNTRAAFISFAENLEKCYNNYVKNL